LNVPSEESYAKVKPPDDDPSGNSETCDPICWLISSMSDVASTTRGSLTKTGEWATMPTPPGVVDRTTLCRNRSLI